MRVERADCGADKGWYVGPWNADLTVSIGYANKSVDEPHVHQQITEICLVARGTSDLRVEQKTISLEPGDVIVIEPGEDHTFLSSSLDTFHFVAHLPGLTGTEAKDDRKHVCRTRLGL